MNNSAALDERARKGYTLPMRYYPLFLSLADARCLVVGAGPVGRRKIADLLSCAPAELLVVDPALDEAALRQALDGQNTAPLRAEKRAFRPEDVEGRALTFAATPSAAVNSAIARLCRACGVEKVLTADAFDLAAVRKALEECTAYDGVSVLITRGDCVFVSRSPKPARVVDADKCIACGKCIQSGCPSVVLSDEKHPKTGKRKARIEPVTCVGCGICAQICPVHAISGPEQA